MKALTCAGYDYMKLMVAELQRQLKELEEGKSDSYSDVSKLQTPIAPPRRVAPGKPSNLARANLEGPPLGKGTFFFFYSNFLEYNSTI